MAAPDFYSEQAAACEQSARNSDLPEQRNKFMRAQIAWQILADKKHEEAEGRERRLAEKQQHATTQD